MENSEHVLSVNNQLLGDLINSGFNNLVGSYTIIDLIKKHVREEGKAVLYGKLSGVITHTITLDENGNFRFVDYKG